LKDPKELRNHFAVNFEKNPDLESSSFINISESYSLQGLADIQDGGEIHDGEF
jgi:hypothetical protein